MEDTTQVEPAKAVEIAQHIVGLLVNETSETRLRTIQAAMILLGETPTAAWHSNLVSDPPAGREEDDERLAKFFSRDEKLKPSDHVYLSAAYHFSLYGIAAFSIDDLRSIARNAGVVLPDRIDKTLNAATKNGRKLFQVAGKGTYKPTASAGLVFKERWDVKPGRKEKPTRERKAGQPPNSDGLE